MSTMNNKRPAIADGISSIKVDKENVLVQPNKKKQPMIKPPVVGPTQSVTGVLSETIKTSDIPLHHHQSPGLELFEPNKPNENNQTPLHYASVRKNLEMMSLLLNNGADANACDAYGDTPFTFLFGGYGGVSWYVQSDNYLLHTENCLFLLLQYGANINKIGKDGATCLFLAVNGLRDKKLGLHSKINFITKLINAGADVNISINKDRRRYVEIEEWDHDNDSYVSGDTPLHAAVTRGNIDVVNLLLFNNSDINRGNKYKQTALHYSLLHKQNKIHDEILHYIRKTIYRYVLIND